jgi:cell division protease FtsH
MVDSEVKRILDAAFRRAREILEGDLQTLHLMAEALLERETLDRDEVALIAEGKDLPPLAPAAPKSPPSVELKGTTEGKAEAPGKGILGTPPAEPAGA